MWTLRAFKFGSFGKIFKCGDDYFRSLMSETDLIFCLFNDKDHDKHIVQCVLFYVRRLKGKLGLFLQC